MQKISEAKEKEIREMLAKSLTGTRYESLLDKDIYEIVNLSRFIWNNGVDTMRTLYAMSLSIICDTSEILRDYLPDLSEYYAGSEAEIEPEL